MSKDIKEYLKYYPGCEVMDSSGEKYELEDAFVDFLLDTNRVSEIKPILRKLESMTEDEGTEFVNIGVLDKGRKLREITEYAAHFFDRGSYGAIEFSTLHPQHFHYLLSRGFDLWNLIDENLAIDKSTLTPTP